MPCESCKVSHCRPSAAASGQFLGDPLPAWPHPAAPGSGPAPGGVGSSQGGRVDPKGGSGRPKGGLGRPTGELARWPTFGGRCPAGAKQQRQFRSFQLPRVNCAGLLVAERQKCDTLRKHRTARARVARFRETGAQTAQRSAPRVAIGLRRPPAPGTDLRDCRSKVACAVRQLHLSARCVVVAGEARTVGGFRDAVCKRLKASAKVGDGFAELSPHFKLYRAAVARFCTTVCRTH